MRRLRTERQRPDSLVPVAFSGGGRGHGIRDVGSAGGTGQGAAADEPLSHDRRHARRQHRRRDNAARRKSAAQAEANRRHAAKQTGGAT